MWLNAIQAKLNLKQYWRAVWIAVAHTLRRKVRYKLKGFEDFTGIKLVRFHEELSLFCI